jgi:acyl-CoA dehydrogenase
VAAIGVVTEVLTGEEDDEAIVEGLSSFAERVIPPLEERLHGLLDDPRQLYDESGRIVTPVLEAMREVREESARAGYYGMFAPESVGGGGLGPVTLYKTWEALHQQWGPAQILPYEIIGHWSRGPSFLCEAFSDEVSEQYLADLMAGTLTFCFALSEPDAGSDAWGIMSHAERDGDEWIISGTKQWISNGPYADFALVFAVTDREQARARRGGISCFFVPTTSPGFAVDSVIRLFGQSGGHEGILSLSDVRVPAANLIGQQGDGFSIAMGGISVGRLYNAARLNGLAQWALERSIEYTRSRKTFGRPISENQAVSFPLADCAMDIYASRTMSLDCARRIASGHKAVNEIAMVKAFTTEACYRVFDRAMQVHGGMGLTNETKLYDGWLLARILRIADGSVEMMRRTISKSQYATP